MQLNPTNYVFVLLNECPPLPRTLLYRTTFPFLFTQTGPREGQEPWMPPATGPSANTRETHCIAQTNVTRVYVSSA
jgi:hypothetical protein